MFSGADVALASLPVVDNDIRVLCKKLRFYGIDVFYDGISSLGPAEQIHLFATLTAERRVFLQNSRVIRKSLSADRAVLSSNHFSSPFPNAAVT